jgi:hypothetical protein
MSNKVLKLISYDFDMIFKIIINCIYSRKVIIQRIFHLHLLESLKGEAKCFIRRQSSKSHHKNSMLNRFGKTRF